MRHFVVTARLKPRSAPRVLELLHGGPPFDLARSGLERHMVFVANDQIVFLFEGEHAEEKTMRLLEESSVLDSAGRLGVHIEGDPSLPREAFHWERPEEVLGLTFGPDPGPGDSDGGERY
jgi:hypothetical protein